MAVNTSESGKDDLLLNLIDYQVGHQAGAKAIPSIESVVPFYNASCRVKASGITSVTLEPEGRELEHSEVDGYVSFAVPEFTYMAMVRLSR